MVVGVLALYAGFQFGDLGVALLTGQRQGFDQGLGDFLGDVLGELFVVASRHVLHGGLAVLGGEFFLEFDAAQVDFLGVLDGFEDDVFGDLAGAGFHHDDAGARAGNHEVEVAVLYLFVGGVDDELAVHVSDAGGRYGAFEGDVGYCEGSRRADDDHGVVRIDGVHGQGRDYYLDFVLEVLGEQRPDGPVGEPGGEYGVCGWPAFALGKASGNLAARVEPVLDVDGEGEEVNSLSGRRGGGGYEQGVVVVSDEYGAVRLLGELSGLERERSAPYFNLVRGCH